MSSDRIDLLERQLEREKLARLELENEIEQRARKLFSLYEYHQNVFDSINVAIFTLGRDGEIKSLNRFAQSNFLKTSENIIGHNILEFILNFENEISDLNDLINKDIQVTFRTFDKQSTIETSGRISHLNPGALDESIILTLSDISEILRKDKEIKNLQDHLIESAYRDGVAENAVSILHNIGNILTTIIFNVSQKDIIDDLSLTPSVLSRVAATLSSIKTTDDFKNYIMTDVKAIQLPRLIEELAKNSSKNETQINEILSTVKAKCLDIAEIIKTQQQYANFRDKSKTKILAREIVSDCLTLHKEKIKKREININIESFPLVEIFMDKIGLAQTISNAIVNAIEAIDERFSKDPTYNDKTINISASVNENSLVILFSDNGCGIPAEILSKLFIFGYSTKKRSSGFGLHNCANYMNSNNGKIEIQSKGLNQGATTILTCPLFK